MGEDAWCGEGPLSKWGWTCLGKPPGVALGASQPCWLGPLALGLGVDWVMSGVGDWGKVTFTTLLRLKLVWGHRSGASR